MRRIAAGITMAALTLTLAGCAFWERSRRPAENVSYRGTYKSQDLVAYLNKNAQRINSLEARNVTMTVKPEGEQSVTLTSAKMFVEKPRNFRLVAKILSSPGVDIGSNKDEFWFWSSKTGTPQTVFHCSYDALARGVRTGIPVHPELIMTALGIAEYDPNKRYEVKTSSRTVELIEPSVSLHGQPIQKVTIFRRGAARGNEPQVISYVLRDEKGRELSRANVSSVQRTKNARGETVVLPRQVHVTALTGDGKKVEMRMTLNALQAVEFSPQRAAALFSRDSLSRQFTSHNLATGEKVGPDGVRPVGGDNLMPR